MNLPHVFAKATVSVTDLGYLVAVQGGSHYLADDPIVKARPDLFTEDCRFGLSWTGDPPACLAIPPEDEAAADDVSSAAMTSKVRSRSQAERARAAGR